MGDVNNYGTMQNPSSVYTSSQNPPSSYNAKPIKGQPNKTKEAYVIEAITAIGWVKGMGYPNIYDMNSKVTLQYKKMYDRNKASFKWAGMAALASAKVGEGMEIATHGISAIRYGVLAASVKGIIPNFTDVDPSKLLRFLAEGNRMVYTDIYWQHLCFLDGGLDFLAHFFVKGELNYDAYMGWANIQVGINNKNLNNIWEGNKMLLQYEQKEVLQKYIYDYDKSFWQRVTNNKISVIDSPVAGGKSFQDYVPKGNIGEYNDRWKWISEDMLPAWKIVDAKNK